MRNIKSQGFLSPTAIQEKAIPFILSGRDVLAKAQTGTGKTAAFLLPMMQLLSTHPVPQPQMRAVVIAPTRELAIQIGEQFSKFAQNISLTHIVLYGGVSKDEQISLLSSKFDVVIATPGRLLDLHTHGHVSFQKVAFFVLDEIDQMLDKGFLPDITRLMQALPAKRQNLLFSATIPPQVSRLASQFLHKPVRIEISFENTQTSGVSQHVFYVDRLNKNNILQQLLSKEEVKKSIVFVRTKKSAERLGIMLQKAGLSADSIHGDKSQHARLQSLSAFADGTIRILVATDVASRGIDIDNISHVFNFDVPQEAAVYVHRIGRTGRAGASGTAITLCSQEETGFLANIESLIQKDILDAVQHKWHCAQSFRSMIILRTERLQQKKQAEGSKKTKPKFKKRNRR